FGISSSDVARLVDDLNELRNIEIRGLSTIAPLVDDPEKARWVFSELRERGHELEHAKENLTCSELSMGMTGDFEVAVEEGSTIVRLGAAIFDID
ncbi:MAG: alanine racemase, partial [Actinobacteria bacterium]|nr:alanine racemase [Actinomycetota bacterium]